MSTVEFSPKNPDEVKDYVIDWTAKLAAGETILTSVWAVPTGLTQPLSPSIATTSTTVWIGGGTAGVLYQLLNEITTSGGRVLADSFFLRVLDVVTLKNVRYVRLHLGDTNPTSPLVSDQDILLMLDKYRSTYRAAGNLAIGLAGRFAQKVQRNIDGLSVRFHENSQRFQDLAKSLFEQADLEPLEKLDGSPGAGFYFGGVKPCEPNAGAKPPRFSTGQFTNPRPTVDDQVDRLNSGFFWP